MISPKISVLEIANYLNITAQAVHARIKVQKLKISRNSHAFFLGHETVKKLIDHKDLKQMIIAISVVKGGVGKTTIAENLAIRLALYGLKVLAIDTDPQANLTKGFNLTEQAKKTPILIDAISDRSINPKSCILNVFEGLDLIPSRLDNATMDGCLMINRINLSTIFKSIFANVFNQYDVIIMDCPSTISATVCASMLASNLLIAPLNPDVYSDDGIKLFDKEIINIKEQYNRDLNWKILLNKFDSHAILPKNYIEVMKDEYYSEKLFKSVIRNSRDFTNVKKRKESIFDNFRKSTAKHDIDSLAKEIISLMS
jgi:chromosome partitioning protein